MTDSITIRIREFCRRNLLLTMVATLGLSLLATYSLLTSYKEGRAAIVVYEGF